MEMITPVQLKELLASVNPPIIIDVRETMELKICALPNVMHIPLGNLLNEWHQIPNDRLIITLCHHGYRSLQAAMILQNHGFRVKNLLGGIHAWAQQIDPTMAVY